MVASSDSTGQQQGPQRDRSGSEAIRDGRSKALICLGGNLAVAMSDRKPHSKAMRNLDLAVHIATKLIAPICPREAILILPAWDAPRSMFRGGLPVRSPWEDSMSMVHVLRGGLKPPQNISNQNRQLSQRWRWPHCRTRGSDGLSWFPITERFGDCIEAVFPEFARLQCPLTKRVALGCMLLPSEREWLTPDEEAISAIPDFDEDPHCGRPGSSHARDNQSHDQYNTTIYG